MHKSSLALRAHQFLSQFKAEIMRHINHLNEVGNGELQDGFNALFLDDGWVTLKGCSWGFVMQYDDPVRFDMTFGPDQPFIGYRITFLAKPVGRNLAWVNIEDSSEIYFGVEQFARHGLWRLASKVGDSWLLDTAAAQIPSTHLDTPIHHIERI